MFDVPKLVKDGKVAVLVSPGFGAGWSTWVGRELRNKAIFCPEIAQAVIDGKSVNELKEIAEAVFPGVYNNELKTICVHWLSPGTLFRIEEYEGSESIHIKEDEEYSVA